MLNIDHLLWAVPDLHAGMDFFEELTGVRPVEGGSHPGRGTRNALLSFGDGRYIELLGPDPAQDPATVSGGFLEDIQARSGPGLLTFAMQCTDMDRLEAAAATAGLPFQGPFDSSRAQPDGTEIHWRLSHTTGSPFGLYLPFYIDWLDTKHPSVTVPGGLTLLDFEVVHPQANELNAYYQALDVGVRVRRGDRPGMRALIKAGATEVVLSS